MKVTLRKHKDSSQNIEIKEARRGDKIIAYVMKPKGEKQWVALVVSNNRTQDHKRCYRKTARAALDRLIELYSI